MVKSQDPELALLVDRFMRRIHGGLQQKADEFDKRGVGPGGGVVLMTLGELGCVALSELTQRVARDKSQMTRTIRSLEAKGLVRREPSKTDARVSLISLTEEGRVVVDSLVHAVGGVIDEILEPIDAQDQDKLKAMLRKIV